MQPVIRLRHPGGVTSWSEGPIRIGRAPDNDLLLDDESLSRHHAEIRWGRTGWVVFDLDSANGTWVDGVRKPQHRLRAGDLLVFGKLPVQVTEASGKHSLSLNPRLVVLASLLILMSAFLLRNREAPVQLTKPAARVFEARLPAPPAGVTAERALAAAGRFAEEGEQSGAALAHARRALQWARQLGNGALPPEGEALEKQVVTLLDERFQTGRAAYIRARRLGRHAEAEAALRVLRETFPFDDPRSYDIDRLEERP